MPNGANMHPDLGVFACDECFEKFVILNWGDKNETDDTGAESPVNSKKGVEKT